MSTNTQTSKIFFFRVYLKLDIKSQVLILNDNYRVAPASMNFMKKAVCLLKSTGLDMADSNIGIPFRRN